MKMDFRWSSRLRNAKHSRVYHTFTFYKWKNLFHTVVTVGSVMELCPWPANHWSISTIWSRIRILHAGSLAPRSVQVASSWLRVTLAPKVRWVSETSQRSAHAPGRRGSIQFCWFCKVQHSCCCLCRLYSPLRARCRLHFPVFDKCRLYLNV
jgi:hypothetical protein